MRWNKNILQLFFILAFVMAQVSPVCAFFSGGRSLIEICAADGSKKIVSVAGDFSPVAPKKENIVQKDCALCLHQGQGALVPEGASIAPPAMVAQSVLYADITIPVVSVFSLAQARAPPLPI